MAVNRKLMENVLRSCFEPWFLRIMARTAALGGRAKECLKALALTGPGLRAVSLVSFSFVMFYVAFRLLAPWIHSFPKPPDPNVLVPWFRVEVTWSDGLETAAMFLAVPAYLIFCAIVAIFPQRIPWLRFRPLQLFVAASPLALLPVITNSCIYSDLPGFFLRGIFFPLAVGGFALLIAVLWTRVNRAGAFIFGSVLWFLSLSFNLLTNDRASIYDYSYFIGPAREILHGTPVREVYQLYNTALTGFFIPLVGLKLWAHQMHAALLLVSNLWVVFYYLLARFLLRSRSLALLFVVCIFVVRFAALTGGPAVTPGVLLLRTDLWVLPFLALVRFGVVSFPTATAFSLGYIADDTFGLLCLLCYGLWLIVELVFRWRKGLLRPGQFIGIAVCFVFALWVEFLLTGGVSSPAGIEYSRAKLGFIPVSPGSAFWGLLWLTGLSAAALASKTRDRSHTIFLFVIACVQLIYFLGRSHDHNLLVISGPFILILFLAIERIRNHLRGLRFDLVAGTVAVILSVYGFAGNVWPKIWLAQSRIKSGHFVPVNPLDQRISQVGADPRVSGGKTVFLSAIDAYLYYRFDLPDPGGRIPISGRVDRADLVRFLKERSQAGYTILVQPAAAASIPGLDWSETEVDTIIQGLNKNPLPGDSEFVLIRSGPGLPSEVRFLPKLRMENSARQMRPNP